MLERAACIDSSLGFKMVKFVIIHWDWPCSGYQLLDDVSQHGIVLDLQVMTREVR